MQRIFIILACFFICAFSSAQQYPFVHYTPRDGLISNTIGHIYQDSRGRLYFTSMNGLSVYDGTRFINYTTANGLANDLVNCIMEMGDDSLWIVTNINKLNCLVNGKIKTVALNGKVPIVNRLCRNIHGTIYAAADEGLYRFDRDHFTQLPFTDTKGKDLNQFVNTIVPVGSFLLIHRDNSVLPYEKRRLHLYDTRAQKTTDEIENVYSIGKSVDGRIWVSTEKKILSIDTVELKKGKIILKELDDTYEKIRHLGKYFIIFDSEGSCWLGDGNVLNKAATDGTVTSFTKASGLSMTRVDYVMKDKEGTIWIATNNGGVDKLVHLNFSLIQDPYTLSPLTDVSYSAEMDELLLYSSKKGLAAAVATGKPVKYFSISNANEISAVINSPNGMYGIGFNSIYKFTRSGATLYPHLIAKDTLENEYCDWLVDKHGNLVVSGRFSVTAIINGKMIYRTSTKALVDRIAMDTSGNIWITSRVRELIMFRTQPNNPSHYLKKESDFSTQLAGLSPRSITIDKNKNIWIGVRDSGIFVFSNDDPSLKRKFHLTTHSGLSNNFITDLATDADNNIWACSPAGLDKISIRNGSPVIENLTKQNSIYHRVDKVVADKHKTAWALTSNGLIRVVPEQQQRAVYSPKLMVSLVKAGKDTIAEKEPALTHRQNNLSFYFAATSFLNEKQVLYSYQLSGGRNDQWSDPSNNATVSFIDLPPGNYTLNIKAKFPSARYPEQIMQYVFSITPPWWQTWWFRSIAAVFIIALLVIVLRIYYRRKLQKQTAALEAIEKERTRIATDMHDDLGAGLSRIKFLSEGIRSKKGNDEGILKDVEKISAYSDEMAEKMGEIVWALNEKNDTVADLVAFTRTYAVEYLSGQNIVCRSSTPLNLPSTFITGEVRQNIFLSVKECLHNIVKHANATQVDFSISLGKKIEIVIHDNGKGIDMNAVRPFSNGLQNVRRRMKNINGKVAFNNVQGTRVTMTIPLVVGRS